MYLIDTNALIYHMADKVPETTKAQWLDIVKKHFNCNFQEMEWLIRLITILHPM